MISPGSVIAIALVWCGSVLHAAPAKPPSDPLALLIEHGLPDVRGAQRVCVEYASHLDTFGDPPGPERKRKKQNCWLLHEEPGGRLTLLMKEVRVVYGQRMTREEMETRDEQLGALGEVPEMIVTPVDLQAEFRRMGKRVKPGAAPALPKQRDEAEQPGMSGDESLLFLAHLQQLRQPGVSALVGRLFPARTFPDLLDDAWQSLAGGRLENTCGRWIETGDAAAYAADLEALLKDAPPTWEKRDAVRLLADDAREAARRPLENEAAEVLVNLRIANLVQLPLDQKWLLPELKEPPLWPDRDEVVDRQFTWDDRTIWVTPEAQAAAAQTPVAAFFRRRLAAAQMLLPLLKSRRPTRLLHPGAEPHWTEPSVGLQYFASRADSWPEPAEPAAQPLHKSYEGLYRTYEVRELAFKLLGSVYPEYIFRPEEFEPRLTEWLGKLDGKDEVGIAWTCIELSAQPSDSFFGPALALLVERRPPESAERLRNLLCDPMIWHWRLVQLLAPLLPAYVDALGPERKRFVQDLLTAVKFGIDSRLDGSNEGDDSWGGKIGWHREDGVRALKLVRLLTEQATLIGLVNRFASLQDAEADAAFDALSVLVRGHFDRALEAQLFQTAARLPETKRRLPLLEIAPHFGGSIQPGPPMDVATRAAVATLLADQSDDDYGLGYPTRPAQFAEYALLRPRMNSNQDAQWQSLRAESKRLGLQWSQLAIAAAQEGKALPPIPDGPAFTTAEISTLAGQWQNLSGLEVLAAFHALPPESQLRLMRGLGNRQAWEAPFLRAQLTIVSVDEDAPEPEKLKGRMFDRKLRDEMGALVQKAAAQGHSMEVTFDANEILSGTRLTVSESTNREYWTSRKVFRAMGLPGLGKRDGPDFEARESVLIYAAGVTFQKEAETLAPGWKNGAITEVWRREYGGRFVPASIAGRAPLSDPAALAEFLARIQRGELKYLESLRYRISASPLVDP